jgi:exodeoxyribonuclease V gamma subunit
VARSSIDSEVAAHGLVIYRASRLEALIEPLLDLLDAVPPEDPLVPQTVLAAHPGMRHWLARELARARGPRGIVANLEVLLPSSYIDRLAQQHLGAQAVALPGWRFAQLRWALFELLDEELPGLERARLQRYLGSADGVEAAARRRFQLAERLARLFSQYLIYRPDWLGRWQRGQRVLPPDTVRGQLESELIAPLWRAARARLGEHRAEVLARLRPRLDALPEATPLHVFGLHHAPPQELAVLSSLARSRLVALYVPDPCREYWGGLGRGPAAVEPARIRELTALEAAGEGDYYLEHRAIDARGEDHFHPLLARLGRLGQQFFMALADIEGVREDTRHWRDRVDPAPENRLQRLQESLRRLEPALLACDVSTDEARKRERADDSLRVHACHSRLRELETLHEVLLAATQDQGDGRARFAPADIVVMAPDIHAYAALIPAVFGAPGDPRARLPYHLADLGLGAGHRLFAAVRRLLALPAARLTAPELVDLLQVPEVARRFGLDARGGEVAEIDDIAQWLATSRAAAGLDAGFRTRFALPPLHAHSHAWALDRLLAGYLMEDAAGPESLRGLRLADGTALAPLPGVHGAAAEQVGALDALLQALQALIELAEARLPASRWGERLEAVFDALLAVDPGDAGAREAAQILRRELAALSAEPAAVDSDPELPFALVRDLLLQRLDAVPERQPFLLGGITFCGMVPQRAIPFGLVAVLGLNEGEFPRRSSDAGLDLMAAQPRLYDREQRSDDRYLFLETLMSARGQLHLSYLGADPRDGSLRNPAAPLAELLALLDAQAGLSPEDQDTPRPWRVQQPLQPFDAALFESKDPALFSHRSALAGLPQRAQAPTLPGFAEGIEPAPAPPPPQLELRSLAGFFRDPARQVLAQGLQLRLDALEGQALAEREPLEIVVDPREQLAQRLLFEQLLRGVHEHAPEAPPLWLAHSGLLPPGRLGPAAWALERARLDAMLARLRDVPGFAGGAAQAQGVELQIGGTRLSGEVDGLFARPQGGHWLLRAYPRPKPDDNGSLLRAEEALHFGQRLPLFLDWACLRLASAVDCAPQPLQVLALLDAKSPTPWIDALNAFDHALCAAAPTRRVPLLAALRERLQRLLDVFAHGQGGGLLYLPRASWSALGVAAEAESGGLPDPLRLQRAVGLALHGGGPFTGELDFGPGYARLLFGDRDFSAESPALHALRAQAEALQACIDLADIVAADARPERAP